MNTLNCSDANNKRVISLYVVQQRIILAPFIQFKAITDLRNIESYGSQSGSLYYEILCDFVGCMQLMQLMQC